MSHETKTGVSQGAAAPYGRASRPGGRAIPAYPHYGGSAPVTPPRHCAKKIPWGLAGECIAKKSAW
jgi:hypothetical protein